jgi:tyrosyl-tRNA synthetase
MGGSDQWGNITTGTELIRRKEGGEAFALTAPLVTKADGTKFGKSEGGNIWLDPELTSPYKFYQFWLNIADEDLPRLLRVFSLFSEEKVKELESLPNPNEAKRELARDITIRVHSEEDYQKAVQASGILFGKSTLHDLQSIDEKTLLEVFEGVPQQEISRSDYETAEDVLDLLADKAQGLVFSSKGEARRMIKQGGVSINKVKLESESEKVNQELLLGKYLVIQRGKKNYFLLKVNG